MQKGEVILYHPSETIKLEVRLENETVWLTQQQRAELFVTSKQNISLHVNNIYKEKELLPISTVKESLTVQKEGKRSISRVVKHYNLDVIISVGYRVKSHVGTGRVKGQVPDPLDKTMTEEAILDWVRYLSL